ncbi:MAG: allene oxide cyclase family protein [Dongiaceae bacterium]
MRNMTMLLACAVAVAWASPAFAKTIKLVERATTDAVTDLGAKDDSAGDLLTFANEVYDETNTKLVGSDNGWCIRVVAGKSWECFWTMTLGDGQITVEGPFLDAGDSVLAITGGTGKYAKSRGEMKLHARNAEGSEYDFVYNLE